MTGRSPPFGLCYRTQTDQSGTGWGDTRPDGIRENRRV